MGISRRSAILLPTLLAVLMASSRAAESSSAKPTAAKPPPASPIQPARTNLVEPLSNGLRLSMKKEEVLKRFEGLTEGFGGLVESRHWTLWYTPGSGDIERCTLKREVRLACGIGVGDSIAKVRATFPGGATSGGNYQVVSGQYDLLFEAYQEQVTRIRISPVGRRFVDESAPPPSKPKDVPIRSLVGSWYVTRGGGGTVVLKADGTYTTGVGGKGTYRADGNEVLFEGALEAWNGGRGTLSPEGVLEFYWKNREGFPNHIVLLRGKE
jgi:hypothetical protein